MSDLTPSALAALAKQHLSLAPSTPNSRVPKFYLDELRRHLSLCPEEHKFRITLQPKVGLGTAVCLKEGCNATIALLRRVRVKDGGKKDGFGSLSAYREHLLSHASRQTLVKPEPSNGPSVQSDAILKTATTLNVGPSTDKRLPAVSSSIKSLPSTPHIEEENKKPNLSLARVKPEPVEASIPRKRLSDVAFGGESSIKTEKSVGASGQNPVKKVKTEGPSVKSPFSQVTNVPIASESRDTTDMNPFGDTYDPQTMLDNVRVAIFGQQNMLNRLLQLPVLDAFHYTLIDRYETELHRLRAMEQNFLAQIPTTYAGPSQPHFQGYDDMAATATSQNHVLYRQTPIMPGSFPTTMGEMEVDQHAATGSNTNSLPVKLEHNAYNPNNGPPQFAAVASGSRSIHFSTAPNVNPIVDVPMASPDQSDDADSSDDEDNGEYDYAALGLAEPFVEQLGIRIPPPINDDAHDDNGDYHGRGRDLFVGPQATSDDLEKFLREAGNAEAFDGNESVEKALKYLGLNSLHHKLPGMDIVLMPHQVMGVAWMLEKERTTLKGGCLADEMGLGKTVQMMATLVLNLSDDPARKTNLIIAPLALLDQWKEEIESKTTYGLKCIIYHGPTRTRRRSELLKHDIVLTTFQTMASEWPDYENEMKKKAKAKKRGDDFIDDSDAEDMKDYGYRTTKRKQQAGLLFQTEFYRVIADEGQNIRNRRTRMSRAITDLNTTYRWCLTGTPIVNSLADVYGLIRFLKIRPWYDWAHFQSNIGVLERKNPGLAVARLQKLMSTFLLRRKKDSKLDGKNLIELPEKKVDLVKLEFSEEEREIYNMVEARSQARFNRYLRAGTVLKNYHQVLVLLLRLRQICSHPSLIQEDGVRFVNPDEAYVKPEFATELTRARRMVSEEFVTKLKEKFLQIALERMAAEKQSANATIEEEECPICYDPMADAVVTGCCHLFCRECITDVIKHPNSEGATVCPVCRAAIAENCLFSRQAFEPTNKELDPSAESEDEDEAEDEESDFEVYIPKSDDKGKGRAISRPRRLTRRAMTESDDEGDDVLKSDSEGEDNDDDDDMSDFIVESDEDEEEKDARRALKKKLGKKRANVILDSDDEPDTPEEKEIIFGARKKHAGVSKEAIKLMPRFLPSTKMKYMMDQLQKRSKSHPEEKTLLVSQWTGCLSLISDYLSEKGIPHVKYQGDMSRTKRDQAVQIFMSREKARVMLMSLKCGGVGLNLTRANNVISLDLGWSQAVESQAFDRVHRVGQEREVLVQRVVIADTVEDRILKMQERKQTLADGSLGEGEGKKIGRLSVKELANLFGLDARGRRL